MNTTVLKDKNSKLITNSSLEELSSLVKDDLIKVNSLIIANLESNVPLVPMVAKHLVNSGGKRIRPVLTLLSSKLFGYNSGKSHIELAACVEFIHMATLLHDDVIDNSALRRGSPTANSIWGNKTSVLIGDFLFSKAFQLMVKNGSLKILNILSDTSSILAQGEVMQLSMANNIEVSEEKCFRVIEDKTAKLFEAACKVGGVISNAKEEEVLKIAEFGKCIGISFQLIDDAMDYSSDSNKTGKRKGDDFREGKVTLPLIMAVIKGNQKEKNFWKRVIEDLDQNEGDFEEALKIINKYDTIEETIKKAKSYSDSAIKIIGSLPQNPYRDALIEISSFSTYRNS